MEPHYDEPCQQFLREMKKGAAAIPPRAHEKARLPLEAGLGLFRGGKAGMLYAKAVVL